MGNLTNNFIEAFHSELKKSHIPSRRNVPLDGLVVASKKDAELAVSCNLRTKSLAEAEHKERDAGFFLSERAGSHASAQDDLDFSKKPEGDDENEDAFDQIGGYAVSFSLLINGAVNCSIRDAVYIIQCILYGSIPGGRPAKLTLSGCTCTSFKLAAILCRHMWAYHFLERVPVAATQPVTSLAHGQATATAQARGDTPACEQAAVNPRSVQGEANQSKMDKAAILAEFQREVRMIRLYTTRLASMAGHDGDALCCSQRVSSVVEPIRWFSNIINCGVSFIDPVDLDFGTRLCFVAFVPTVITGKLQMSFEAGKSPCAVEDSVDLKRALYDFVNNRSYFAKQG